jgi:putative toxin-antitoxin system antitoxin component (TIGR02293 family)
MAHTRNMRLRSGSARGFKAGRGRGESLGLSRGGTVEMVRRVQNGFPYAALVRFHKQSGLAVATIADLVQLPQRTLMRRKASGRLRPDESERLLRVSGVFEQAVGLCEGDADAARRWLTTPSKELNDTPPLEFARTEIGAREVEDLIGRLEHGVFT